jgi:hypothetical protein
LSLSSVMTFMCGTSTASIGRAERFSSLTMSGCCTGSPRVIYRGTPCARSGWWRGERLAAGGCAVQSVSLP